MPVTVYLVHGLRLRSEIPLAAPCVDGDADLEVRWGEGAPVGDEAPRGEVIASVREDGIAYTVAREGDDLRFRLHGTADFHIRGGSSITVTMDPATDGALASVFLTAAVPAVIHTAAGACVLHASAVAFDGRGGRAIGFVGGSGAGKSTLSALCCASGARLVSEDLLRVRFDGERPVALPGVPEIRLRPAVAELAEVFPSEGARTTPDGRTAISLASGEEAPLVTLLLPAPVRGLRAVEAERLGPAEALVELGRYPRVLGWRTPDVRAARFRTLARLTRSIPVVRVRVPWGPPFDPGLVEALRNAAGLGGP